MAKTRKKARKAAKKRPAKGRKTKARKTTKKRKTAKGRKTTKRKTKRAGAKRTTKARKTTKRRTTKKAKGKSKRKPNAAFMAPMTPTPALAAVIGPKAVPRTQVVKKLWQYIKRRNLQDPKNRRNIRADDKLLKVFKGKKTVSMFEMTKLVSSHLKAA